MPFLGFSLPSFLFCVFFIDDLANSPRWRTQRGKCSNTASGRSTYTTNCIFRRKCYDDHSPPLPFTEEKRTLRSFLNPPEKGLTQVTDKHCRPLGPLTLSLFSLWNVVRETQGATHKHRHKRLLDETLRGGI